MMMMEERKILHLVCARKGRNSECRAFEASRSVAFTSVSHDV